MMKNQFSFLLYGSKVLALLGGLFLTHGCGCDCGIMPTMTIGDLISSDAHKQSTTVSADVALDSTNKYFNLYPELKAVITGPTPHTFFAPSNTAFISLTAVPGLSNLKNVDPDIIKSVLLYHFVEGQKLKADLAPGVSFPTLYTETKYVTTASPTLPSLQNITVNTDGTLKTGSSNPSIVISMPDIMTTNGLVHIVATVMIPPSIGTGQVVCLCGNMAATIRLGKDFTQLMKIVSAADANFTETTTEKKIVTYLAMPAASFPGGKGGTFFATANATLPDATVTAITSATDKGRSFLLNHLVAGKYGVAAGTDVTVMATTGQTFTAFSTKTINVVKASVSANVPNGVIVTTGDLTDQSKHAPIIVKDLPSSNGLIQVIGGVLQ